MCAPRGKCRGARRTQIQAVVKNANHLQLIDDIIRLAVHHGGTVAMVLDPIVDGFHLTQSPYGPEPAALTLYTLTPSRRCVSTQHESTRIVQNSRV